MTQMLDESTKEYFDLKFGDVIKEIKETTKKNTSDIISIEKKVDQLELYKTTHEKHHESKEKNMKFNLEMWVIVAIFLIDKIFQYVNVIA